MDAGFEELDSGIREEGEREEIDGVEAVAKLRDKVAESEGREVVAKLGAAAAANAGSNLSATLDQPHPILSIADHEGLTIPFPPCV